MTKVWQLLGWGMIYLVLIWGWTVPINLYNADIGRHLANGKLLGQYPELLNSNFYAYTWTNFSFYNHHWLYGVISWWIYQIGHWSGLSLFNLGLNLVAVSLIFGLAWRQLGSRLALLTSLVFLPLIINRYEVRPEVFSNLLILVFGLIISGYLFKRLSAWWLVVLLGLQLLWVNLHIYFFWGLVISGAFLASLIWQWLWQRSSRQRWRWPIIHLTLLLLGLILVSLVNPHGYFGLMMPLLIYGDHGYRILEEQSVWFLVKVLYLPSLTYYFLAAISLLLMVIWWFKNNWQLWRSWQIIYLVFGLAIVILGGIMIRNFAVFGLVGLALTTVYLNQDRIKQQVNNWSVGLWIAVVAVAVVLMVGLSSDYWTNRVGWRLGVDPAVFNSAQFFRSQNLTGPIFNNYDIGGYLIWELFPSQQIFVDNRPEAYPASFFEQVYVPAQEDNDKWQELDNQYHFQTIYFNHQDLTPWAQQFLKARVQDQLWSVVYLDQSAIIMVKNIPQNQPLIEQYGLDRSLFQLD